MKSTCRKPRYRRRSSKGPKRVLGVFSWQAQPSVILAFDFALLVQCPNIADLLQVHFDPLHGMSAKHASHSDLHGGVMLCVQQLALYDVISTRTGCVLTSFPCEGGRHFEPDGQSSQVSARCNVAELTDRSRRETLCFGGSAVLKSWGTTGASRTSLPTRGISDVGRTCSFRTITDESCLPGSLKSIHKRLSLRTCSCSLRHSISLVVVRRESGHADLRDTAGRCGKASCRRSSETERDKMGRLWPDPRGDQSIEKKQSATHSGLARGLERTVASSSIQSYQNRSLCLLDSGLPSSLGLSLRWFRQMATAELPCSLDCHCGSPYVRNLFEVNGSAMVMLSPRAEPLRSPCFGVEAPGGLLSVP
jgi:hypothetical protein